MIYNNEAEYTAAKAHLEAAGFTNLPAPSSINFAVPAPVTLNANIVTKQVSISTNPPLWLIP